MKGANIGTKVAEYSTAWKKTFDCDQPISVDDATFEYAAWVEEGRQGEHFKESAFESCKNYKGTRRGWVFKLGALGLGYYQDGVPEKTVIGLHKMLWPIEHLAPSQCAWMRS